MAHGMRRRTETGRKIASAQLKGRFSMAKFAVILAGSGIFDGTEIHEAVSTLISIKKHGGDYVCFAPDRLQAHTINHLSGEVSGEERNILVESARIALGKIHPLEEYSPNDFDALIFPGEF